MTSSPGEGVELVEDAPAALVVTNLEGRIRSTNGRFRSWMGCDVDSAAIRDHLTVASQLYYETVVTPRLSVQGEMSDVVLELVGPDGVRHAVWAARRVGDAIVWVGIDVTDRRLHEQELVAVQRRLARLQRLSSKLLTATTAETIGEVLLAHLVDGVKADRGLVAVRQGSDGFDIVATHSLGSTSVPTTAPGEDPHVSESVEQGSPVFTTIREGGNRESGEPTQVAALPLVGDGVIGVVWLLLSRDAPHSDEERELLAAAADIASSSLGRAVLHQRLADDARRNASLSQLLHSMEAETSLQDRAQRMADHLVPEHGDMAVVELDDVPTDLAGVRHADRSREATIRQLFRGAESEAPAVDDLPSTLAELGLTSSVRMPLVARGREIGLLTIASVTSDERSEEAMAFLERLTDACALALDNARLYDNERRIAQYLQSALLPEQLPTDARVGLYHFYQAAREVTQVGGDWYDALLLDADRLAVMVGDVVGGGVVAARTMGRLRTVARAYAREGRGVAGTLTGMQRFAEDVSEAFASSAMVCELDLATGTIEYGSAGHLPAVLVAPGSEPALLTGGRAEILGFRNRGEPAVARSTIPPGGTVVLYTDGLIERPERSIDASIDELLRVLRDDPTLAVQPEVLASKLDSDDRRDDTCVLAVHFVG